MAAKFMVLQNAIVATTNNPKQDKRDAVDVGAYTTVVVQVNVLVAAASGTPHLVIEHAAVLEEGQFEPHTTVFDLTVAGPKTIVLTGHSRYLRWNTTTIAGNPMFTISLVLRD